MYNKIDAIILTSAAYFMTDGFKFTANHIREIITMYSISFVGPDKETHKGRRTGSKYVPQRESGRNVWHEDRSLTI